MEEFSCTISVSQSNARSSLQTINDNTKVFRADQFEKISKLILINDRSVFLFSFPFTLDVQIYFPCVQAHNKMAWHASSDKWKSLDYDIFLCNQFLCIRPVVIYFQIDNAQYWLSQKWNHCQINASLTRAQYFIVI